jgi:hypothetical protein
MPILKGIRLIISLLLPRLDEQKIGVYLFLNLYTGAAYAAAIPFFAENMFYEFKGNLFFTDTFLAAEQKGMG